MLLHSDTGMSTENKNMISPQTHFDALYLIVYQHMLAESARSADKIKFLDQDNCLHCSIKLHGAGQSFQLVGLWCVRPH